MLLFMELQLQLHLFNVVMVLKMLLMTFRMSLPDLV